MSFSRFTLLALITFTAACADHGELATTSQASSGDACEADPADFATWYEVAECVESNPTLYAAAIGAAVDAGAQCAEKGDDGACEAIDPEDPLFLPEVSIQCWGFTKCWDGICQKGWECCILINGRAEQCEQVYIAQ
jgi:hypothetical protein